MMTTLLSGLSRHRMMKVLFVAIFFLLAVLAREKVSAESGDMRVTLLGTGTPILNVNRFGMSTLVEAGTQTLLFDTGRGAAIRLHQRGVPLRDISAVFFTHLHSDHLTALPDIYATAPLPTDDGRRIAPLEIWGPKGIDHVARGIELMFTDNNHIRLTGRETVESATKIIDHSIEEGVIYDRDGVKVTAFLVDHGHAKPAYGYRVDYAGHSVVLSGDTTYAPNLVAHAKNVDLLVHCVAIGSKRLEAAAPDYVNHFYEYLASPEMVGRILSETKPGEAVLSHISLYSRGDIPRASEEELMSRVRGAYAGALVVGQDLMSFSITKDGVKQTPYAADMRSREPVN